MPRSKAPVIVANMKADEPPSERPKSDLGTQSSSPKTGELTTASNSKVDSLVTEVTEDEVTGPAISAQQHTRLWSK